MKQKSANYKLTFSFTLISFAALLILSALVYYLAYNAKTESNFDHLSAIKIEKKYELERFFNDISSITFNIASSTNNPGLYLEHSELVEKDLSILTVAEYLRQNRNFLRAYIIMPGKKDTLYMLITDQAFSFIRQKSFPKINIKSLNTGTYTIQEIVNKISYQLFVAAPMRSVSKLRKAFLIIEINTTAINDIVARKKTEKDALLTGHTFIAGMDGLSRTRITATDSIIISSAKESGILQKALKVNDGAGLYMNQNKTEVLGSFSKLNIEGLDWRILTEIESSGAYKSLTSLRNILILLLIIFPAIIFVLTYKFTSRYTIISNIKPKTTEDLEMIEFLEDRGI